jgi:pimeloyl-ACP methyl ester carboxylesterase
MALMEKDGVSLYYEVHGTGYPLVLFAPGGMNSVAQMWFERPGASGEPMPWMDPTKVLADECRVVAMDQRNAGGSRAPVRPGDGWASYASDHLALMDHLGIGSTHLMGGCIGSSYCLGVCRAAPDRVTAAVLQNPIGLSTDNRQHFYDLFDGWASSLRSVYRSEGAEVDEAALGSMREQMFGGDFVFNVSRDFVRSCQVPLLVLAGNDVYHPRAIAEEIAALAPAARLVIDWAGPERHDATAALVREFLKGHTPAA